MMRRAILLAVVIMFASGQAGGSPPDEIKLKMVKSLSKLEPTEKRSMVLCVRGRAITNYEETTVRSLRAGGEDTLWALKVSAAQNAQLMMLAEAAQWPEMAAYFKTEMENVSNLIRGQTDWANYRSASKENEPRLGAALAPELSRQDVHKRNFNKLSQLCEELTNAIIARAKTSAVGRP